MFEIVKDVFAVIGAAASIALVLFVVVTKVVERLGNDGQIP